MNASDKKTLTVSKAGTIRIKLVTSETDTHMKGVAIATLFVDSDDLRAIQDVIDKIKESEQ